MRAVRIAANLAVLALAGGTSAYLLYLISRTVPIAIMFGALVVLLLGIVVLLGMVVLFATYGLSRRGRPD